MRASTAARAGSALSPPDSDQIWIGAQKVLKEQSMLKIKDSGLVEKPLGNMSGANPDSSDRPFQFECRWERLSNGLPTSSLFFHLFYDCFSLLRQMQQSGIFGPRFPIESAANA
jgi:hypothetical protein